MKDDQKREMIQEDNDFFVMTEEKDKAHEKNRVLEHKNKMDKYLGDYDN